MVEFTYKKNHLTSDKNKLMANMLFKKDTEKKLPTEKLSLKKEEKFSPQETTSSLKQETDISLRKQKATTLVPEFEIWNNSIKILSTYITSLAPHYPMSITEIGESHIEILQFFLNSKDYLTECIVKGKPTLFPLVSIEESVQDDYIICLEDGQKVKMLAPYLSSRYKMTKKDYIKKWNLPHNYPFTAPSLSKKRREKIKQTRSWLHKKY